MCRSADRGSVRWHTLCRPGYTGPVAAACFFRGRLQRCRRQLLGQHPRSPRSSVVDVGRAGVGQEVSGRKSFPELRADDDALPGSAHGDRAPEAITGAQVALEDAFRFAEGKGWLRGWPVRSRVAATSAGRLWTR